MPKIMDRQNVEQIIWISCLNKTAVIMRFIWI